ncbi:MAG TPA: sigma-70 family RNA polymerase sigma factor [Aggregatilineales bacterium]|nr:sigma-70 family RNA polymerase sigma factor [Anaerolineales bacterium]HRE48550.1 sigma-70 family RNA polymerase sigma factor [Aggregatilineales bacterium]
MDDEHDEQALIAAARRGTVEAFNALIERHQRRAYNLAYRLIGDPDAAADATQEAVIAAYNNLGSYRGGSFRGWLMRIVTNTSYDELRRRKRRPTLSTDQIDPDDPERASDITFLADPDDEPEEVALRHALNDVIQACLDGLSVEFRMVAVLADVQGYDYSEIAAIVNTSLGTVKSRLSRARERLRTCLQGAGELLPARFRLRDQNTTD